MYGFVSSSSGNNIGVYGRSNSINGVGVIAYNYGSGTGLAAYSFGGNIIDGYEGDPPITGNSSAIRFKAQNDGDVYSTRAFHCGIDDGGNPLYIDEGPTGCLYDEDPANFIIDTGSRNESQRKPTCRDCDWQSITRFRKWHRCYPNLGNVAITKIFIYASKFNADKLTNENAYDK